MIRTRSKRVLLVAANAFPDQLLAEYNNVKHISLITAIFPSIHELKPEVILFDHAHMADNLERYCAVCKPTLFTSILKFAVIKKPKASEPMQRLRF
jgi:hypothetical protein